MTDSSARWTRRQFSQALAASAAALVLPARMRAASLLPARGFAFVGAAGKPGATGAIHVFEVSGSHWRLRQRMPVPEPVHLEAHPTLPVLYAVHDVALWEGLPRGAVSAYGISDAGLVTLHNTQPLSLSAIHPRHAAVSPDGRYLMVAAERGGLYNLLPIAVDGSLEPPTAIRKELGLVEGSVAKTATPHQVVFHPDGSTVFTADSGQESIAIFALDHESIDLRHRVRTHAGAGPSRIVLSASGDRLYAQHAGNGSISMHTVDRSGIHSPNATYSAKQSGPTDMTMHPDGRFLLTASEHAITTHAVCHQTGRLSAAGSLSVPLAARTLAFAFGGMHLLGLNRSGNILHIPFDLKTGKLSTPQSVAGVEAAMSLLFRSA